MYHNSIPSPSPE